MGKNKMANEAKKNIMQKELCAQKFMCFMGLTNQWGRGGVPKVHVSM